MYAQISVHVQKDKKYSQIVIYTYNLPILYKDDFSKSPGGCHDLPCVVKQSFSTSRVATCDQKQSVPFPDDK